MKHRRFVRLPAASPRPPVRIRPFLLAPTECASIIESKRYGTRELFRHMAPDEFRYLETTPQASTDKTDYQALPGTAHRLPVSHSLMASAWRSASHSPSG